MVHVIILAGGKGTRMKAEQPKVLTPIRGIPMIRRVLQAVRPICSKPTIIVGFEGQKIVDVVGDAASYVWQREQLGTGHAVQEARAELDRPDISEIVVLYGDHPLISEQTGRNLIAVHQSPREATITMATVEVPNFEEHWAIFERFGRILRDSERHVCGIVEWKDATEEEKKIREVNPGYYCFNAKWLWENISRLENKNASGEYYLTDLVGLAVEDGKKVQAMVVEHGEEGMGVNTQEELVIAEHYAV